VFRSENNSILGAILRLIPRGSARISFAGRAYLVLPTLLLLGGSQAAHANQCFTNGPRYQLESDAVEWQMKIHSGDNCVRGVRFSYVWNATVSLVSLPQFGRVTLIGTGFLYSAKSDFHGEDSFVVGVSGFKNKTNGFSTIRVVVSVVGAQEAIQPATHNLPAAHNFNLTDLAM
jgi:hypothetical protein